METFEGDLEMDDFTYNSEIRTLQTSFTDLKFTFLVKGGCLIYIGMTRIKGESSSFMRK